jgi:hypothetical protein
MWDHRTNYTSEFDPDKFAPLPETPRQIQCITDPDVPFALVLVWLLRVGMPLAVFATVLVVFWYFLITAIMGAQVQHAINAFK